MHETAPFLRSNSDLSDCCDRSCRGRQVVEGCRRTVRRPVPTGGIGDVGEHLVCSRVFGRIQGSSVCGARQMSSAINRLRPPPTAAPAAPLLHLPLAAQRLAPLRGCMIHYSLAEAASLFIIHFNQTGRVTLERMNNE